MGCLSRKKKRKKKSRSDLYKRGSERVLSDGRGVAPLGEILHPGRGEIEHPGLDLLGGISNRGLLTGNRS